MLFKYTLEKAVACENGLDLGNYKNWRYKTWYAHSDSVQLSYVSHMVRLSRLMPEIHTSKVA